MPPWPETPDDQGGYDTPSADLIWRLVSHFRYELFSSIEAAEVLRIHPGDLDPWLRAYPCANGLLVAGDNGRFYIAHRPQARDHLPPLRLGHRETVGPTYIGW